MSVPKFHQHPALKEQGIALEYFPHYLNFNKNLHSTDVVLLSFIIRGKGTHYLGERAYPEQGPSLSITHFGQVHDIVTDKKGMEIMNLYLNLERFVLPAMPAGLQGILHQILPLHPNFYPSPDHMTRLEFKPDAAVTGLVMNMHREFMAQDKGWSELVRDYFRIFLAECCRQALKSGVTILGKGKPFAHLVMEPVRRYLDLNYTEHVSIESLARRSGYSGPYLCRLFKEYTGKTLYDYILDKRAQTAMMLLRSTDKSVSRVAMESGFSDISFFNKLFRRKVGMAPREYRSIQTSNRP
ncbi:MAG: AraC family transcriptional regulator [Fibrobacterota bacterium]